MHYFQPHGAGNGAKLNTNQEQQDHDQRQTNPTDNGTAANEQPGQPQFKENPEVNAKIDDYIKNNPKHWDYIQSLPPDRMARALVLNEVQKTERNQKMGAAILRKLDKNPEIKASIANIVSRAYLSVCRLRACRHRGRPMLPSRFRWKLGRANARVHQIDPPQMQPRQPCTSGGGTCRSQKPREFGNRVSRPWLNEVV